MAFRKFYIGLGYRVYQEGRIFSELLLWMFCFSPATSYNCNLFISLFNSGFRYSSGLSAVLFICSCYCGDTQASTVNCCYIRHRYGVYGSGTGTVDGQGVGWDLLLTIPCLGTRRLYFRRYDVHRHVLESWTFGCRGLGVERGRKGSFEDNFSTQIHVSHTRYIHIDWSTSASHLRDIGRSSSRLVKSSLIWDLAIRRHVNPDDVITTYVIARSASRTLDLSMRR